jgi:hypothetical protein
VLNIVDDNRFASRERLRLIERNSTRSLVLGPEHRIDLADGRREYSWTTDRPRLFEAYILRWRW